MLEEAATLKLFAHCCVGGRAFPMQEFFWGDGQLLETKPTSDLLEGNAVCFPAGAMSVTS